jgi:methionine-rich copper-binding protein CopC
MISRFFSFATLVSFLLAEVVFAHSYLSSSSVPANSILKTAPELVTLEFTEPLELGFSTFKVYKLETKITDSDKLKLEAQKLVARVLSLKNDLVKRADDGLETTASQAARIKLKLKPNLKPGIYVVMYRVLSVDTHITQDFFTFSISSN